ncbi:MAG: Bcr/CflA family efflux MFS transporter [Bradyrhizobiaceae bacterium]|nr:MAG: Bcr/CflA family efflux MFS transporter [Bradyrhizobiaceae bacterium]
MTETNADGWVSSTHRPMGFPEFVAIVAGIMALNPIAMDLMLPALPEIGHAFAVANENAVQNVLSVFVLGFGIGQFIMGPLTDRFGRRRVLILGMTLYIAASVVAALAPSFGMLLLARLFQGLSTSATRVIATSMVRDCYTGRRMASILSLITMIFIAVPVIAPSFGQLILLGTGWRGIFVVLFLYGIAALIWSALRLPETLPMSERKSLEWREVLGNYRRTITNRQTLGYSLAAGGVQAVLYGFVFSAEQIFTDIFDLGRLFPIAFACVAVGIAAASLLNSRLVGRLGMRVISHSALVILLVATCAMALAVHFGMLSLAVFMPLAILCTFSFGLSFANFTALALEPQGHIAGTASSMFGTMTTLVSTAIGYSISQGFDGSLAPFAAGSALSAAMALAVAAITEKGRLFRPHGKPV